MSNTSPPKEQFCSFISEFIDKSKKIIVESDNALDYDAVELTLLLKSIGFQLKSLEFSKLADDEAKDIEIEIKCKRSGIHSKLQMISNNCSCPPKKAGSNNNSFWEVQGIAPGTQSTQAQEKVQDTSCNLLPEISKKTNNMARTMLTILHQHYKADFDPKEEKVKIVDVKEILERFQARSQLDTIKPNEPKKFVSPNEKNNVEKNTHCSTPLSSINVTPVPSYDGPIVNVIPKVILVNCGNETSETNSTTETDKQYVTSEIVISNSCESISSSSNVLIKDDTFDQLNSDSEKEICLIQSITEARKQLDSALLLLKCNVTREISPGSSILTVTPRTINKKGPLTTAKKPNSPATFPNKLRASSTLGTPGIGNLRRHSFGGRNELQPSPSVAANKQIYKPSNLSVDPMKRKPLVSAINNKTPKPDTPRPTVGVDKKSVNEKSSIKRGISGIALKASTLAKPSAVKSTTPKTSITNVKKVVG